MPNRISERLETARLTARDGGLDVDFVEVDPEQWDRLEWEAAREDARPSAMTETGGQAIDAYTAAGEELLRLAADERAAAGYLDGSIDDDDDDYDSDLDDDEDDYDSDLDDDEDDDSDLDDSDLDDDEDYL